MIQFSKPAGGYFINKVIYNSLVRYFIVAKYNYDVKKLAFPT